MPLRSHCGHDILLDGFNALEQGISRHHAMIYLEDQALKVMDLGSANGTTSMASSLSRTTAGACVMATGYVWASCACVPASHRRKSCQTL